MKAIFRLAARCGNGVLYGIFVEEKEKVSHLIQSKREVKFNVLGKVAVGCVHEDEIEMICDEEGIVSHFERYGMETGYNPFKV